MGSMMLGESRSSRQNSRAVLVRHDGTRCSSREVVSPIGRLAYKDKTFVVNNGAIGPVTQMLYDTLTGVQWGRIEDKFGWTTPV